ncbi:methylated-DNA--[protein]-cysteine S-methyltransferase [soil metagenome]
MILTDITRFTTTVTSPVGDLSLCSDGEALTGLYLPNHPVPDPTEGRGDTGPFADALAQLDEYFAGERTEFDLALDTGGTPFQQEVWAGLRRIPHGETMSYGELAEHLGRPGASRAVGSANGRNPIPIIIPCHRVIAADGTLGGYGGGLACKTQLLALEGVLLAV